MLQMPHPGRLRKENRRAFAGCATLHPGRFLEGTRRVSGSKPEGFVQFSICQDCQAHTMHRIGPGWHPEGNLKVSRSYVRREVQFEGPRPTGQATLCFWTHLGRHVPVRSAERIRNQKEQRNSLLSFVFMVHFPTGKVSTNLKMVKTLSPGRYPGGPGRVSGS